LLEKGHAMRSPGATLLCSLYTAAALCFPASAETPATPASWDQERVTELAAELTDEVDRLYDVTYKALPSSGMAGSQSRQRHELQDTLRLLRSEARHLHARLAKGDGREQTRPVYRRIKELRRDAAEEARMLFLPNDVTTAMDEARDVWMRMHPYYQPS
jgi:hypothetical protein